VKARRRKELFDFVFARDRGCCSYCGRKTEPLKRGLSRAAHLATLDHVIPRSMGGQLFANNLVLACQGCNNERGTMEAGAFRVMKARASDG
jgi:5-methylcytosine-specific restriction endonuclease McrA